MKQEKLTGSKVPRFTYDTPAQAENDFYALCAGETPLVLVFLPNFGHPISRAYVGAYLETLPSLTAGRLACVVRSNPKVIAASMDISQLTFPLICDADGVLYDYFNVGETTRIWDWTFAARRIINEAKKQGYAPEKGAPQLLPLTLILGAEGNVIYAHRGRSITDLPEDCETIQTVCEALAERMEAQAQQDEPDEVDAFTPQQAVQGEQVEEVQAQDWFDVMAQEGEVPVDTTDSLPVAEVVVSAGEMPAEVAADVTEVSADVVDGAAGVPETPVGTEDVSIAPEEPKVSEQMKAFFSTPAVTAETATEKDERLDALLADLKEHR